MKRDSTTDYVSHGGPSLAPLSPENWRFFFRAHQKKLIVALIIVVLMLLYHIFVDKRIIADPVPLNPPPKVKLPDDFKKARQ